MRCGRRKPHDFIADADSGYGNALNVVRAVREFEAAGVAGTHLEDQVSAKRRGEMPGAREVVSLMAPFQECKEILGLAEARDLEVRFLR